MDYRTSGLDRALFQSLGSPEWIYRHRSALITGPCGAGKSWLACALRHAASRADRTLLYYRLPRLFSDLELAHGDGRFDRLFRKIVRVDLLILDDWGLGRLSAPQRRDLMETVEERYGRRSTIVTSQLPVETWHDVIGEPTFADASSIGSSTTPIASPSTDRRCARPAPTASAISARRPRHELHIHPGLPTGSHAPVTTSRMVGAAPGPRAPPADNFPPHRRP